MTRLLNFLWLFVFLTPILGGCMSSADLESTINNRQVELVTGLDPSKIYVISGSIITVEVDQGSKLERTQDYFELRSLDGVKIDRRFPCVLHSESQQRGSSGEFFGYLQVSGRGAREPTKFAKERGIPQYEDWIMNAPGYEIEMVIHVLENR